MDLPSERRSKYGSNVSHVSSTENLLVMEILCSSESLLSVHMFMNPTGNRTGL